MGRLSLQTERAQGWWHGAARRCPLEQTRRAHPIFPVIRRASYLLPQNSLFSSIGEVRLKAPKSLSYWALRFREGARNSKNSPVLFPFIRDWDAVTSSMVTASATKYFFKMPISRKLTGYRHTSMPLQISGKSDCGFCQKWAQWLYWAAFRSLCRPNQTFTGVMSCISVFGVA
jgi:hypothetical protein